MNIINPSVRNQYELSIIDTDTSDNEENAFEIE